MYPFASFDNSSSGNPTSMAVAPPSTPTGPKRREYTVDTIHGPARYNAVTGRWTCNCRDHPDMWAGKSQKEPNIGRPYWWCPNRGAEGACLVFLWQDDPKVIKTVENAVDSTGHRQAKINAYFKPSQAANARAPPTRSGDDIFQDDSHLGSPCPSPKLDIRHTRSQRSPIVPAVASGSGSGPFLMPRMRLGKTNETRHSVNDMSDSETEANPTHQLQLEMSQAAQPRGTLSIGPSIAFSVPAQSQATESDYGGSEFDEDAETLEEALEIVQRAEKKYGKQKGPLIENLRLTKTPTPTPPQSRYAARAPSPTTPKTPKGPGRMAHQMSTPPGTISCHSLPRARQEHEESDHRVQNQPRRPVTRGLAPPAVIAPSATQATIPAPTPSRARRSAPPYASQNVEVEEQEEEEEDEGHDSSFEVERFMDDTNNSMDVDDLDTDMFGSECNSTPSHAHTLTSNHGLPTPDTSHVGGRFKNASVGPIPMRKLVEDEEARGLRATTAPAGPFSTLVGPTTAAGAARELRKIDLDSPFEEVLFKELMDILENSTTTDAPAGNNPSLLAPHIREKFRRRVRAHGAHVRAEFKNKSDENRRIREKARRVKQAYTLLRRERDALAEWRENAMLKAIEILQSTKVPTTPVAAAGARVGGGSHEASNLE